ncbi:MAG TPA: sugar-binding protein, partial [Prolixibacteraceae bacterium]|nr:sugar-binding protein [Prolixibacteraceae bacterium]
MNDSLALVALYRSTDGDNWTDRSNWLTGPVSSWYGITLNGDTVSQINLGNNNLNGVIPPEFGNLDRLDDLNLDGNLVSDISGLAGLNRLYALHIRNNSFPDISVLSGLTNLVFIDLVGNNILDLSPLASLTKLESLWLHDNQINDLSPLSALNNLQTIHLASNQISDLSPLTGLINLRSISLASNQIENISPLSSLTFLTDLMFENNRLENDDLPMLYPLDSLTNQNRKTFGYPDSLYFDLRGNIGFTEEAISRLADSLQKMDLEYILWNPLPDTLSIPFRPGPVVIDGIGDEAGWLGSDSISVARIALGEISDSDDLSAFFKVCWDLDSLYLFLDVTDDSLNNEVEGNWWENDFINIFLDMDNSHSSSYDENDWQFSFVWEKEELTYSNRPVQGLNFKMVTDATHRGYRLEFALPLWNLGFPFQEYIGIDVQVNDNDGGETREAILFWNSEEDQNWNNPGLNGYGRLEDYYTQLPDEAIMVLNASTDPCGSPASEITVDLFNFGTQAITQFDILYAIDGDTIAPETANVLINPGDTVAFTFATPYALPLTKSYSFYASTLIDPGNPHTDIPLRDALFVFGESNPHRGWSTYSTCNGLPNNQVHFALEGNDGDMWISTYGGGIARLDTLTQTWTVYDTINSNLTTDSINGLLLHSDGSIWACLDDDNGVAARFDGANWTLPNPENIHTTSAFEDSRGDIWFGTWDHGVRKLDVPEGTITTYTSENSGLAADIVLHSFAEDDDQNIWIGTTNWGYTGDPAGLCKFDGTTWTVFNTSNCGIPANEISCLIRDSSGNLWMGHGWINDGMGLTRFDGENWQNFNTGNSGIISNVVLYLYEDPSGNIWIGTNQGISKYDGTCWQNFYDETENGQEYKTINSIVEDSAGKLWCTSNNGVFVMDKSVFPSTDTLDIPFTEEPITIDGLADEQIWQNTPSHEARKIVAGNYSGTTDLKAEFKVCWNLDTLFFFAEITDENRNNSASTFWENDYVEFFLDMDHTPDDGFDENDHQVLVVWDDLSQNTYPEGTVSVFTTHETGYRFEMALPFAGLGFPFLGEIGFDFHVSDNDGGENRQTVLSWHSATGRNWENPSHNGTARLLGFNDRVPEEAIIVLGLPSTVCGTEATEITVDLFNFGTQAITQFDILYAIDGDTIAPETAHVLINPGDPLAYTFTTRADLSFDGMYSLFVSTLIDNRSPHANIPKTGNLFVYGEKNIWEGWTVYSACTGRPVNRVWNMTTDSNGAVWIASGPAEKFDPASGAWSFYDSTNSAITNNKATDILEDHLGNIWIALDEEGAVATFDGNSWSSINPDNIHVLSIFEDSGHNLWFGTWDHGVRKYNPDTEVWETYTVENSGLASNIIYKDGIMEDSLGNLWFGTAGNWGGNGGLCKFDGTTWTTWDTVNSSLPNNQIICSIMDRTGKIWMGFGWNRGGVSCFDGANWTNYSTGNSGIGSDDVFVIYEDNQSNI